MKPKTMYLLLCLVGTIVPYWQFAPWLAEHGLNLPLFFDQLLFNRVSTFFGLDVTISAVALILFIRKEGGRLKMRGRWLPIVAVFTVGVSLGLPLFLYLRERTLEEVKMAY